MISYSLACDRGHGFESWFRSSNDFDRQHAAGFVACPVCGSTSIEKQIMAPNVARTDRSRTIDQSGAPVAEEAGAGVALLSEREAQLRAMLKAVREQVVANSEDVGKRFAEEARKIHYGESEQRSIYGEATAEDARALNEEGVEFHALPTIPDERN